MALYKVARTRGSKHIGKLYNNIDDAIEKKKEMGQMFNIFERQGKIGSEKLKWIPSVGVK